VVLDDMRYLVGECPVVVSMTRRCRKHDVRAGAEGATPSTRSESGRQFVHAHRRQVHTGVVFEIAPDLARQGRAARRQYGRLDEQMRQWARRTDRHGGFGPSRELVGFAFRAAVR